MTLFDPSPKHLNGARDPNMTLYEYRNRSDRSEYATLRTRAEEWASRFPIDDEFLGRFKGKDDRQHRGAFFELFMHEFLLKLEYEVKRGEPLEDGKKTAVDFCAYRKGTPLFYVECTLAGDSMTDPSVEQIKAQIEKAINEVKSPDYWLEVDYIETSTQEPKKRMIKRAVRVLLDGGYEKRFGLVQDNGWNIRLTLRERSPESKKRLNPITVYAISGGMKINEDPYPKLWKALSAKKPSKYGSFDLPYIIAINSSEITLSDHDIVRILFGLNPGHTAVYPKKTGFFHNGRPINTNASGMMLFSNLYYFHMNPHRSEIWENPWAKNPIGEDWDLWMDRVRLEDFGEQFRVDRRVGKRVRELMIGE